MIPHTLVESSLAETLLVIIVALFAVMVFYLLVSRAYHRVRSLRRVPRAPGHGVGALDRARGY